MTVDIIITRYKNLKLDGAPFHLKWNGKVRLVDTKQSGSAIWTVWERNVKFSDLVWLNRQVFHLFSKI